MPGTPYMTINCEIDRGDSRTALKYAVPAYMCSLRLGGARRFSVHVVAAPGAESL